jgi:hemoglobin
LTAARAAECASAAALWGYRPAALLEAEAPDASYADFASFAAEMARLPVNVYTALSRDAFFDLARAFYARVDRDPRLRAMFPPSLEAAAERQALFLIQFFGGPAEYSEKRGAPRLRMRHAEFPIDAAAADAWLENMRAAVRQVGIEGPARGILERYLTHTARMLVNRR